jgi:hypothetical protein
MCAGFLQSRQHTHTHTHTTIQIHLYINTLTAIHKTFTKSIIYMVMQGVWWRKQILHFAVIYTNCAAGLGTPCI